MKRPRSRRAPAPDDPPGFEAPSFDWDPGAARTLSQRIAETLREAIIRGDLLPGQPLRQVELARRLRVSFAPLREAMRQLEAEGFVRFTAFQGAMVAPLEVGELRDFTDILCALESIAARDAVPAVTPEAIAEAERCYEALLRETDLARAAAIALRIRIALYAPSGRHRLIDMVRFARLNSHRWVRQVYAEPEGRRLAAEVCRGLIDRFRAGDAEEAARFVEETYRNASRLLERSAEEIARRAGELQTGAATALATPDRPRRRSVKRRPRAAGPARPRRPRE